MRMTAKFLLLSTTAVILALTLGGCNKQSPMRYSQQMINARMTAWYNKDNCVGFPNANSTNGITMPENMATWDYVPGVVAKGILDVWQYYQDSAWADAWYIGLAQWADQLDEEELNELVRGGILDDLNCAKVFMGLYEGAKPGGKFENAERAAYYMQQMQRAARGLAEHAAKYSIHTGIGGDGETLEPEVEGGWMHKATDNPEKSYWGQMWCDGAYMGPALLAQLLQYGACEGTGLGWNDVVKQFTASWPYLWDEEKQLPYHVLFTDVTVNKNARVIHDSGHAFLCNQPSAISHQQSPIPNQFPVYHSEEYWGRAAGWYILALVDVMEAYMKGLGDEAQSTNELPQAANFETLHEYLTKLANGLIARQDKATGCWYQLLQYGAEKCATQGIDDTGSNKYTNVAAGGTQCNYLESSASCLITAALLKATRLGLGDYAEAGKRGFEGIQKQFIQTTPSLSGEGWGEVSITSACQSAGLSHDRNGSAAYYLIGKDVPIQDNTEGKVLGAYLMAAVEYERACQR